MKKPGTMMICDRCGKKEFFGNNYMDEIDSRDWEQFDGKDLCPTCADELSAVLVSFFAKNT